MSRFIAWFCFGGMIGGLASHKTDDFLVCFAGFYNCGGVFWNYAKK